MSLRSSITFTKNLFHRFNDDDVLLLATHLAYNLLFSFFPFLIFLFSLLAFIPIKSEDVVVGLSVVLPHDTYSLLEKTIKETLTVQNTKLLSFSLIFTVFAASSGFGAVIKGLNKAYDISECRNFFYAIFVSIICTAILVFTILAAIVLLIFGHFIGIFIFNYYGYSESFEGIWHFLRYLIAIVALLAAFSFIYSYAPCKRLRLKKVIFGAIFSTSAWILASASFTYYVDKFGNYQKLYGSLGAVVVFLLWLYLSSVILLIGGEINAELANGNI